MSKMERDLQKQIEKQMKKANVQIALDGSETAAASDMRRGLKKAGLEISSNGARKIVREARKSAK